VNGLLEALIAYVGVSEGRMPCWLPTAVTPGEVYADVFGRRKGTGPLTAMSHSFVVPPKNIMAAVVERHNRSEARTQVVALLHKGWWREDYSEQEFSHVQQALQQILNQRVPGWWRLRHIFLKFRVCSDTEFSRIKETSWKNNNALTIQNKNGK
jgi:hypothetical protein